MVNATIQRELVRQMAVRMLKFNVTDPLELEEVIDETADYISWAYDGLEEGAAGLVSAYLDETMQNYPEHIEPIREYIEPIAA